MNFFRMYSNNSGISSNYILFPLFIYFYENIEWLLLYNIKKKVGYELILKMMKRSQKENQEGEGPRDAQKRVLV